MTITTISEVKFEGQFTSEFSDDEINNEIDLVESELYQKYNLPKRSQFSVDSDYTDFYIYPDKIYDIVRVQAQVDTTVDVSGYTSIGSDGIQWRHLSNNNYITLGSDFLNTYDTKLIRVQSIPLIYNMIARTQSALNLLNEVTIINEDTIEQPIVTKLKNKLLRYKSIIKPKITLKSSDYVDFDKYEYISYSQSELR